MKNISRYLALLLAVLMISASFASCADERDNVETNDSETESETTSDGVVFAKSGEQTKYKIIYADECTDGLVSVLENMTNQINSICSGTLMMCFPENAEWDRATVDTPEILIGETNRAESIELQASITANYEYAIKAYPNGRIVIAGSSDQMLIDSIAYFAANYVTSENDGYLSVPEDLNYRYHLDDSDAIAKYWKLSLPEYAGGILSPVSYNTGMGKTMDYTTQTGKMQIVSKTTGEEFSDYLALLSEKGYGEKERNEVNGCVYVQYYNAANGRLVYAYYIEALGEARIIEDTNSMLISDFEYTCVDGEAAIYQYGMMGDLGADPYEANGMFYIIRLADNKLILVDGGQPKQATDIATEALIGFMREITGKTEGEKIDIAAIFVSHVHGDHLSFPVSLLSDEKFSSQINVERFMCNVPTWTEDGGLANRLATSMLQAFPNVKFLKPHTGQSITLGNATIDVMFTHEDFVNAQTGKTTITEFNNTTTVIKVSVNGKSIMLMGDWSGGGSDAPKEFAEGQRRLLLMHTNEATGYNALNADILQVAHHSFNTYLGDIYAKVSATYAFIPSVDIDPVHSIAATNICISQVLSNGGSRDRIYFQTRYTYCLAIAEDGTVTVAAEDIRGVDTGDNEDTAAVTEKDYISEVLSVTVPYRTPTEDELANWALIHG